MADMARTAFLLADVIFALCLQTLAAIDVAKGGIGKALLRKGDSPRCSDSVPDLLYDDVQAVFRLTLPQVSGRCSRSCRTIPTNNGTGCK